MKSLLDGNVALSSCVGPKGDAALRIVVTLARPSSEADRQHWNSVLAFADIDWMNRVRVWDTETKWLWPNLPYLLRLPGWERVERYGGMDPRKNVDNDFAAVLIRKYDSQGLEESAETRDSPLVSAEWHPPDAAEIDLQTVVHSAQSDAFLVHLGEPCGSSRGHLKIWLIYADFFGARAPRGWPAAREFMGGILAYFEIDWETSPDGDCRGTIRHVAPRQSTDFDWARWALRRPGMHETEAVARLSDTSDSVLINRIPAVQ